MWVVELSPANGRPLELIATFAAESEAKDHCRQNADGLLVGSH
jgi:hypothetical protein